MPADARRREYALQLRDLANLKSETLVNAFAKVPREQFLGPGPWNVLIVDEDGKLSYTSTSSSNPEETYQNAAIAIDPVRGLHNGHPQCLAGWMDSLLLSSGMSVAHIGCGTGYYTAILAEVVGRTGRVLAFEIDPVLAARAAAGLKRYPHVEVIAKSPGELPTHSFDAIFVNCGVTIPPLAWLSSLRNGARLVLPITASSDDSGVGGGTMFMFVREGPNFSIHYLSPAAFFPCSGARDPTSNAKLLSKSDDAWLAPRSVRLDLHAEESSCWLHSNQYCLSTVAIDVHAA